jgi:hypothetical protein
VRGHSKSPRLSCRAVADGFARNGQGAPPSLARRSSKGPRRLRLAFGKPTFTASSGGNNDRAVSARDEAAPKALIIGRWNGAIAHRNPIERHSGPKPPYLPCRCHWGASLKPQLGLSKHSYKLCEGIDQQLHSFDGHRSSIEMEDNLMSTTRHTNPAQGVGSDSTHPSNTGPSFQYAVLLFVAFLSSFIGVALLLAGI